MEKLLKGQQRTGKYLPVYRWRLKQQIRPGNCPMWKMMPPSFMLKTVPIFCVSCPKIFHRQLLRGMLL